MPGFQGFALGMARPSAGLSATSRGRRRQLVFGLPLLPQSCPLVCATYSKCPPAYKTSSNQPTTWDEPEVSVFQSWSALPRSNAPVKSEPPAARNTAGSPVPGWVSINRLMPKDPLAAVRFSGVQSSTAPVFASTLITALAGLVVPPCTVLSHWQAATIVEPASSMSRTCGGVLCA